MERCNRDPLIPAVRAGTIPARFMRDFVLVHVNAYRTAPHRIGGAPAFQTLSRFLRRRSYLGTRSATVRATRSPKIELRPLQ
jgi:hypothetical protein